VPFEVSSDLINVRSLSPDKRRRAIPFQKPLTVLSLQGVDETRAVLVGMIAAASFDQIGA
jgi:hypothetical protein